MEGKSASDGSRRPPFSSDPPDFSRCNLTSAAHLRSIPDRLPSIACMSKVKHGRIGIPTDEKRNYATVVEAEPITQARLITKDQGQTKRVGLEQLKMLRGFPI